MLDGRRDDSDEIKRISDQAAEIFESLRNAGGTDSSAGMRAESPKDDPSKQKKEERLEKALKASTPVPDTPPPTPEWAKLETLFDSLNRGDDSLVEIKAREKLQVIANSDVLRKGGKTIIPNRIETGAYYIVQIGPEYWLLPDAGTLKKNIVGMGEDPSRRWHSRLFEADMRLYSTPGLQKAAKVVPASGGWDIVQKGLITLPQTHARNIQNTDIRDQHSQKPKNGWAALALVSAMVFSLVAASQQGDNTRGAIKQNGRNQNLPGRRDAGTTYANTRIVELEQKHKKAILRCEHEKVIRDGTSLARTIQGDQARKVQDIVNKSRDLISALDQPGKWGPYTEDPACKWGYQWFDNTTYTSFRVFVAVSQSCENPTLYYSFAETKNGPSFSEGKVSLAGHGAGEVRLPFPGRDGSFYAYINRLDCG